MNGDPATSDVWQYDWTSHEKTADVAGRKLRYAEFGDPSAPAILFIHGIMGSWRHWVFNVFELQDRFRVIAIDLPGFGASQMPARKVDIRDYADAVVELAEQLELRDLTLVGNSMGGMISAVAAKARPDVVKRIVLVDAVGVGAALRRFQIFRWFAWLLEPGARLTWRHHPRLAHWPVAVASLLFWAIAHPFSLKPEVAQMLLYGGGRPAFLPAVQAIARLDVRSFPGEIEQPTLIVWGRNDATVPIDDAFVYMGMIDNSQVKIVRDCGHLPMIEKPEEFNALLAEFVGAAEPVSEPAAA